MSTPRFPFRYSWIWCSKDMDPSRAVECRLACWCVRSCRNDMGEERGGGPWVCPVVEYWINGHRLDPQQGRRKGILSGPVVIPDTMRHDPGDGGDTDRRGRDPGAVHPFLRTGRPERKQGGDDRPAALRPAEL